MRQKLAVPIGVCFIAVSALAMSAAQQGHPGKVPPSTMDDVLKEIRADLQNDRADVMAKNLQLSTSQAAQFWPKFELYQKEQNAIMDDQLKSVQWFIEHFEGADDAAALKLINTHFERDAKMVALRQRWLGEFQSVVGTKLAVRVLQIDRRLSLVHQAFITSKIPLVH
jgi:hypothetical protein